MNSKVSVREIPSHVTLGPTGSTDFGTGSNNIGIPIAVSPVSDSADDLPIPSRRLGAEQLYASEDDSYVSHVLSLLRRARVALEQAAKVDPTSTFNAFEQEMMVARAHVGRALKSREIGPGFTAVVGAINWALANRSADILTKRQINALVEALNRLLWAPYLHFDTAMLLLDSLDDAELNIESPYLAQVTSELDV